MNKMEIESVGVSVREFAIDRLSEADAKSRAVAKAKSPVLNDSSVHDIKQFLKKKTWTGEEVGKALIYSTIHTYEQSMAGNTAPKTLFPAEQLTKMLSSLTERNDGIRYNRFLALHHWLSQNQAVANAYYQRLQGDITVLTGIVTTAKAAEMEAAHIQRLPVIMTQKQFNDFKTAVDNNLFVSYKKVAQRAQWDGIAIITPGSASSRIDENGYYKEPEPSTALSALLGLGRYTLENENFQENIKNLQKARSSIQECLYWIKGYNTAIELIAEYIEIPKFRVFQVNHRQCLEQIDALNGMIALLRHSVEEIDYPDDENKRKKVQVLDDLFFPFDVKELSIPLDAVSQAKEMLHDNMRAFETQDGRFTQLLTTRREKP